LVAPWCEAGCRPDRETWRDIRAAGFSEVDLRWFALRRKLSLYDPHIGGVAER
jgi:hypothetical protein